MAAFEPPQSAVINVATATDHTIVAAVTGKKIRVLSYVIVAAAAVAVTWKSGSTARSGAMSFAANSGIVVSPAAPSGGSWFETAAGEALVLTLSGAQQVSGHLTYQVVP